MIFLEKLRDRIRAGEITSTIRIWQKPHVRVGGRYSLPPGYVVVDSIMKIDLANVTGAMARESGFEGVVELLKVATSPGSLGTVSGVQLAAVFQSLLLGSSFQVALPAWSVSDHASKHKLQKKGMILICCSSILSVPSAN